MKIKTTVTKGNDIKRNWHLIDLKGKTLGRICSEIAQILMGKDKVDFSFNRDAGDYVVAVNADKIKVTGRKPDQKIYYHYTNYAGNLREFSFKEMMAKDPRKVISIGVAGMLPKNKLRDKRLARLKVFVGADHKYAEKFTK
ncbi:MAG TPA: 50S ribosomal protein L13 [Patescibacteria group bacterium]